MTDRSSSGTTAASDAAHRRQVRAAAGDWLLRMSDGPLSAVEQAAFEAWRADPDHGAAFAALSETWGEVAQLQYLRPLADPAPTPPLWRRIAHAVVAAIPRPRPAMAGLIVTAVLAAAFVYLPPLLDRPNAEYATQVAQLRTITLSDGSVITLGADSIVEERFSNTERRVVLQNGAAFFEVTHNADRPFFVEAGAATIRVVGTKFDVTRRARGIEVAVLEGEVRVGDDRAVSEDRARVLRPGQRLEVVERPTLLGARAALQPVAEVQAVTPGDWRSGRLTYNGARLADVASDINRYYAPGFTVTDDAADIQVTASFKANEIEGFLSTLDIALPVEVTRGQNGSFAARARHLN